MNYRYFTVGSAVRPSYATMHATSAAAGGSAMPQNPRGRQAIQRGVSIPRQNDKSIYTLISHFSSKLVNRVTMCHNNQSGDTSGVQRVVDTVAVCVGCGEHRVVVSGARGGRVLNCSAWGAVCEARVAPYVGQCHVEANTIAHTRPTAQRLNVDETDAGAHCAAVCLPHRKRTETP